MTTITSALYSRILNAISSASSKLSIGTPTTTATTLIGSLFILIILPRHLKRRKLRLRGRKSLIPPTHERVLILGATSGIGRSIARQYAERGAAVCVVGRRAELVEEVSAECGKWATAERRRKGLGVCADITDVEGLVRVRDVIERGTHDSPHTKKYMCTHSTATEWSGLDTLIIAAGVSALLPLMEVAQVAHSTGMYPDTDANADCPSAGIQRAKDVAYEAVKGNYIGPLVSAVTFIPLLQNTSPSPSILLLSSLAAVIPAPTRTLYASTKSASLMLFQALSIEHPRIAFSHVLPSTVEGDFRASAVDGGEKNVREKDPNKYGLKREDVARKCVRAVDGRERMVFVPRAMEAMMWVYWWFPGFVEAFARRKYNFEV
ncbi:hypothetical protein AX15_005856 [Amanita polypyramis BW_CC]|nr:hypothetical protein AX15_005856 [Amanita polypyramis BW_CC]